MQLIIFTILSLVQKTSTFSRAGGLILLVIISTFIAMMNTSSQFSSLASLLITFFFGTYIFINRKLDYSIQSISSENQSNSNKRFRISSLISTKYFKQFPYLYLTLSLIFGFLIQKSVEANGSVIIALLAGWFYYFTSLITKAYRKSSPLLISIKEQLIITFLYLVASFMITKSRTLLPSVPIFSLLLIIVFAANGTKDILKRLTVLLTQALIIFVTIFYLVLPFAISISPTYSLESVDIKDRKNPIVLLATYASLTKGLRAGTRVNINNPDNFNEVFRLMYAPIFVGSFVRDFPLGNIYQTAPSFSEQSVNNTADQAITTRTNMLHSSFLTIIYNYGYLGMFFILLLVFQCLHSLAKGSKNSSNFSTLLLTWFLVSSCFSSGILFGMQAITLTPLIIFSKKIQLLCR